MKIKEFLGNCAIIFCGVFSLFIFVLFWVFGGRIWIGEKNKIILTLETAIAAAIIVLGIDRFVDDLREKP